MKNQPYIVCGKLLGRDFSANKLPLASLLNYNDQLINLFGEENIVEFWPLNDKSGTVAEGVVNGRNAQYKDINLQSSGINNANKAVELPSATSVINLYSAAINTNFPRTEGTLMFYAQFPEGFWDVAAEQIIARFYIDTSNRIYIRRQGVSNSINYYALSGGVLRSISQPYVYTKNFMGIAVTWSDSENKIALYIDGLKVQETTKDGVIVGDIASTLAIVGNTSSTGTSSTLGKYSHIILLNKAAMDVEIFNAYKKNANVVFEGDSRSVDFHKYPSFALDLIATKRYSHTNNAVSGSKIAGAISLENRALLVDAMIQSTTNNIIVVWCGVNDSDLTAQQIYDALKTYCLARKTSGYKVIICTEIDGQSVALIENGWPAKYLALNTMIRDDYSFADAVADLGADIRLQNANDLTYFLDDKVHPNYAVGAEVIASIVAPVILSLT